MGPKLVNIWTNFIRFRKFGTKIKLNYGLSEEFSQKLSIILKKIN